MYFVSESSGTSQKEPVAIQLCNASINKADCYNFISDGLVNRKTLVEKYSAMKTKIIFDEYTGDAVHIVDWDFRNLSAETFRRSFDSSIQKPLKRLLNEFNKNSNVEMPPSLRASMLGLLNGLADFYSFILSRPEQQQLVKAHEFYGSHADRKAGWIHFQSVSKMRKTCLSIIDQENREAMPFILSPRSIQEVERTFFSPAFASQMMTVQRGARPGFSFPILVFWKITELVPTQCPDTFMEPKIIRLVPEAELGGSISAETSRTILFETALLNDESLHVYLAGTCAICQKTGVTELQRCSKCNVARYCGREHKVEHWKEHKKLCKRLRILKDDASERANGE